MNNTTSCLEKAKNWASFIQSIVTPEGHKFLRRQKLIEGRFPNIYVSARIAFVTGEKSKYIKYRGLDENHYQNLVIQFLKKYGSANRKDIDALLLDKLPEILTDKQKINKINRLLSGTMVKQNLIKNTGSRKAPYWVLAENRRKNNKREKKNNKTD